MAVVKANAYGHGLVPMARELEAIGTDWLGVANVAEGAALREAGVTLPILLLSATLPEEMEEAVRHKLTLTLSSLRRGEAARPHCPRAAPKGRCSFQDRYRHGPARLLASRRRARNWRASGDCPGLRVKGLCTHFASADDNAGLTQTQWKAISPFFAENDDLLRHAANSPAVTRRYGFHADMVRVGLALYGIAPNPRRPGPRPAAGADVEKPRDAAARSGARAAR